MLVTDAAIISRRIRVCQRSTGIGRPSSIGEYLDQPRGRGWLLRGRKVKGSTISRWRGTGVDLRPPRLRYAPPSMRERGRFLSGSGRRPSAMSRSTTTLLNPCSIRSPSLTRSISGLSWSARMGVNSDDDWSLHFAPAFLSPLCLLSRATLRARRAAVYELHQDRPSLITPTP